MWFVRRVRLRGSCPDLTANHRSQRTQGLSVGRGTNSSLAGKWILPEAQVLVSSVAMESSMMRISKREYLTVESVLGVDVDSGVSLAWPDPIVL